MKGPTPFECDALDGTLEALRLRHAGRVERINEIAERIKDAEQTMQELCLTPSAAIEVTPGVCLSWARYGRSLRLMWCRGDDVKPLVEAPLEERLGAWPHLPRFIEEAFP